MAGQFTEHELHVIREIALHRVRPNALHRALSLAGYPFEKALAFLRTRDEKIAKAVLGAIEFAIQEALEASIKAALHFSDEEDVFKEFTGLGHSTQTWEDVLTARLDLMDSVADGHNLSNAIVLTVEGALTGVFTTLAEATGPFAPALVGGLIAADVAASMTLLSRQACQIAASYGCDPSDPRNVPHVLAAMASVNSTADESFLPVKGGIYFESLAASRYLASLGKEGAEKAAPKVIQLVTTIAERLGLAITEKELVIVIPVAAAALNGAVNLAFQQVGKTMATDYFRTLALIRLYGEDDVFAALERERLALLEKTI